MELYGFPWNCMVSSVTPRPDRVYGMCNRRVAYMHQGLP